MKFHIKDLGEFLQKLLTLKVAIDSRPVVPELACVRICANNGVTLYGSGGYLTYYIPVAADVIEKGEALVDYSLFLAAITAISGEVHVSETKANLIVKQVGNERIRSQIRLANLENHPLDLPIEGVSINVAGEVLLTAISKLSFAVVKESGRPELQGIHIGHVSMSGDGIRLATYSLDLGEINLTIPSHALLAVATVVDVRDQVTITEGDRWCEFRFDDGRILKFSKLQQEFPVAAAGIVENFRSRSPSVSFTMKTAEALRVLTAMNVYSDIAARQGIAYCTMECSPKGVFVNVDAPTMGTFSNQFPVENYRGAEMKVLFSSRAFLQVLTAVGGDVGISLYSPADPMLVVGKEDPLFVVLQGLMASREMAQVEDEEDF